MSAAAHFSAAWLAMREPADTAARDASAGPLLARLRAWPRPPGPWRVMDLGCGTGANLRWLAPRLGAAQQWLVLDHDAALLRRWAGQPGWRRAGAGRLGWPAHGVEVLRRRVDLAQALPDLPWPEGGLVTASALLDLAGADWLDQLATRAAQQRCALLFALSVDGRQRWTPTLAGDTAIARRFAAHQRHDKGLGPALGEQAVAFLARRLRALGYRVHLAPSDWAVGPDTPELLRALTVGMAEAAIEQDPAQRARLLDWRERRLQALPHTRLCLGHQELLALPPP